MQNNLTKPKIKNQIENLEKYFSKYKNDTSSKKLKEVKENLDKQEYKIAVVANMSSGKSTFINALFGKEVLPTNSEAVTDCATYIYSKPEIEKKAEIFFSDRREKILVTENLEKEIDLYAYKDERIERIEKEKKEDLSQYKNVKKIDLYYPFLNLQTSQSEDFSITFIDTPGPNSTGDYGEEHKRRTRSVLNSVEIALFVFDYEQIDANLKNDSDEQGLWNTIKKRYKEDENFEVYFLINKIDYAMKNNFQSIPSGINNDEFIKQKKENWFKHEKIAIDKIVNAAKKHGIDNPKVYPISSYYQLLERNDKKNFDDEDTLDDFKKRHFKRIFDNWEEEFINYIGISKVEDDINNYINVELKNKILKIALDNIKTIKNDENLALETRKQNLSKPKEEATKNVQKALNFLKNEAKELEVGMRDKFNKSSQKAIEDIVDLINFAIEEELYSKIDEMAKKSIVYVEEIAYGREPRIAQKSAINKYNTVSLAKEFKIDLENHIDRGFVFESMQNYIKSLFEDYKNNYLDVKTDLRNRFTEYEIEISKIFRQVKDRLNSELEKKLDIDIQNIEMQTVDIESSLSFEVSIPNSVLDYNYEENYETKTGTRMVERHSWSIFRLFGSDYYEEEYEYTEDNSIHELIINPKDLKNAIGKNISEIIEQFSSKEQDNYKNAINSLKDRNNDIFEEFKKNKQNEIDKLKEDDRKDREKELEVIKKQLEDFNNLTKE